MAVGDLATFMNGACAPNAPGLLATGAACLTPDGTAWDSSLCRSGHCDLLADPSPCSPLCARDADCGASQVCNIVFYTTVAIDEAVPYDPAFTAKTRDAVMGCFTRPPGATLGVGDACTAPGDCLTSKCFATLAGGMKCSTFCVTDADCPAPMKCLPDAVTLVSWWLQQEWTQGVNPQENTLVRVCL